MKSRRMIALMLTVAMSLFLMRAAAQQPEHQQGGMSQDMMAQHREIGKLIDKLIQSFTALENENDPGSLKRRLREHGALLKELQEKFQQNSGMMGMMGRMSGQSTQTGSSEHSMNMQHAEHTMGFSQTQTTHHFFLTKDGGVIQVETNDPKDVQNRDMIRMHLAHIAQAFAAGDFSDPLAVHDKYPDGVPVMQRLKGEIR